MPRQAVIALGSNLGDSEGILARAIECIARADDVTLTAQSSVYSSEPAVVTNQPTFKNAVVLVETELAPQELLALLQGIEAEFGRVREGADYVPKGPRTLDLDIIDYEGVVSADPLLTLPHPEALRRAFVVVPLLEVSPYHVLANQKVVTEDAVDCGEIIEDTGQATEEGALQATEASPSPSASEEPHSSTIATAVGEEASFSSGASNASLVAGRLYLCATPIGNLGDITLRALETLQGVDSIYCEDTRVTRKLTARYHITTPLKRADAHKLPLLLPTIIDELKAGRSLAYVSDAGMPGISDPGGLLVHAVREAGCSVEVLPGASALTTALALSGIKAHNHFFGGFFPRKQGAATRLLEEVLPLNDTLLVFYESVHRTAKTLGLIAELAPERFVLVARELTKLHEEVFLGAAPELSAQVEARVTGGRPLKGEIVILIAPSGFEG